MSVFFCSWGVARYSRERGDLVAFRDGRRDNDDATSNSITCSYILIYVLVTRGPVQRLGRDGDVTIFTPFGEGTERKWTNPLVE